MALRRQVEARTRDLAIRNKELEQANTIMREKERALRDNEAKYRTLFDTAKRRHSPDA